MERAIGHSWLAITSIFSKQDYHQLPVCATFALHEVQQVALKHSRNYCLHDLNKICQDPVEIDRYIKNLAVYCQHPSERRSQKVLELSDHEVSLKMLQMACPNLEHKMELRKRQATSLLNGTIVPTLPPPTATSISVVPITPQILTTIAQTPTTTPPPVVVPVQPGTNTLTTSILSIGSVPVPGPNNTTPAGSPSPSPGTGTLSNPSTAQTTGTGSVSPGLVAPSGRNSSSILLKTAVEPASTVVPKTSPIIAFADMKVAPYTPAAAPVSNPVALFPTSTYKGQALLTATCAQPSFSAIALMDGSYLAAPIVGCGQANPQCCPSLTAAAGNPTITQKIIPLSAANQELIEAIQSAPINTCPGDYTSTAGNCCPIGFGLYSQRFYGQTPCFSVLERAVSVPPEVSAQISALNAALSATQTGSNPLASVRLVDNELFALSLPLKDGVEIVPKSKSGLSMGAKIGIGVGIALVAIAAIGSIFWFCVLGRRKKQGHSHVRTTSNSSDINTWAAGTEAGAPPNMSQRKSVMSASTGMVSPEPYSPHPNQSYSDVEGAPSPIDSPYQQNQQSYYGGAQHVSPVQSAQGTQTRYSELPADAQMYHEVHGSQPQYSQGSNVPHELPGNASRPRWME